MRSPNFRSAVKVMSAPSPKDGKLGEVLRMGSCDHTGVIHSEMAKMAIRGFDWGRASFKVFVPTSRVNLKTVSCLN